MKKIIVFTAALLIFVFSPLFASAAKIPDMRVLRIRDRQVISFSRMIEEIRGADVILLGESHTSVADHRAQLAVISALHGDGTRFAIGLEMFRADSQVELDQWVNGALPLKTFLKIYYDNWSAPWPLYRDIFLYAREFRIPMAGLNLPPEISDKVFTSGFDSLSPSEKKQIPPGITCTVDKEYMRFIDEMYRLHESMGGKSFNDFCEAQMLWDSVMAWHIVNRLRGAPGLKMVVLTGIGHAWKKGIPAQIGKISNYRCAVVLPGMPNGKPDSAVTPGDADYILMDVN